jgi:hypothetical protein
MTIHEQPRKAHAGLHPASDSVSGPPVLAFVIPCYDDWSALDHLLSRLAKVLDSEEIAGQAVVVNDGGPPPPSGFGRDPGHDRLKCDVVTLYRNHGHQRAIALGLAYAADNHDCAAAVVMDADGEDDPKHVTELLLASKREPDKVVFARRTQRHEKVPFRAGYVLFKWIFRALTGQRVNFGNYSLVPGSLLSKLTHTPELWTHYAAGVLRARLPITTVPLSRAPRYTGKSRMNFVSLVLHGLAAISLYSDLAAVRVLLATIVLACSGILAIGIVTAIRLFTDLATPGWATTVVGLSAMLIIQGISLSLLLIFIGFQQRSSVAALPSKVYRDYIERIEHLEQEP